MKRTLFALVGVPLLSIGIVDGIWHYSGGQTTRLGGKPGIQYLTFGAAAPSCGTLCDDLVSYWNLDETSGTRADSVGSADLTDNNTVGSAAGKHGNAGNFEKDNTESLSIGSGVIPANSDFTIVFWEKFAADASGAGVQLKSKDSAQDQHGIYQEVTGANKRLYNRRGYGSAVELGDCLDVWLMVVYEYVHSTTTTRAVVFGSPTNSGVWTADSVADLSAATTYFSIGGNEAGYTMDGLIDEVAIWSRVLTSDEIAALYASGSGIFYDGTQFADLFLQAPWRYAANDNWLLYVPKRPPLALRALKKAS